jgi:hypothetical protein
VLHADHAPAAWTHNHCHASYSFFILPQLVASTFSRGVAEQDKDSKDASSGGESHHTRTEQFMEILEGEFATKVE